MQDLGWSSVERGVVNSAFFYVRQIYICLPHVPGVNHDISQFCARMTSMDGMFYASYDCRATPLPKSLLDGFPPSASCICRSEMTLDYAAKSSAR